MPDLDIILATDSYKISHWRQYPPGTERVYSYFESRGGRFAEVVFFGLQYVLKRRLAGTVVTREGIERAARALAMHFGDETLFNRAGWEHVLERHDGRLPVSIRAVPEGTPVPVRNVLMTVENTDPACAWLTNHLETLLVQTWYGSTVATLSREMKRLILGHLERTGDPSTIALRLHDFGFRGTSSVESAAIGAAAHLVSFEGTDTLAGCVLAADYYGEPMAGVSIPAAEHSTITAWGPDGELDAYANMLDRFPSGVVACVSDSYDVLRACREHWGEALRERVLEREGTLVVRPDSGDPPRVVLEVLETLGRAFGAERNAKGFRTLPPELRVIQGDGIDYETTAEILATITGAGWSADNVSFGMGGALLQRIDRDTQQFALKCSEVEVAGVRRAVFKDPATDPGKASKRGRLALVRGEGGGLETVSAEAAAPGADCLREVFRDGRLLVDDDLAAIRARAAEGLAAG